ncbi:AMP-binding protein [Streptomyces sp. NBC_00454]|uniref:AMP-binding protein n=1 Tax=Streptomyces sp. NBC_00454 TaxID=2975747 RepID=UPI0030E46156
MTGRNPAATAAFREARDVLLTYRTDLEGARREFRWPDLDHFNWALDWFDVLAEETDAPALLLAGEDGDLPVGYRELSRRSSQVACWLREVGVRRGDRLLLALSGGLPLYETLLAGIKLGAVIVPTYATATPDDLADRIERAGVRHVVTESALTERFEKVGGEWTRICVGPEVSGWIPYDDSYLVGEEFTPDGPTRAGDPLFIYFTSGTTSRPKMVLHTHASYPVGHLSGMYWNGVQPGDLHLNISAPGWAKHSWSSFFVPFNAGATVLVQGAGQSDPAAVLDLLRTRPVTSFCAPPTVWRALLAHGLGPKPPRLREATCAGEPLETSLIARIREAWGVWLRDGYGQTETTAQLGHPPGVQPQPGVMGRPMPGYEIAVLDPGSARPVAPGSTGELCVRLAPGPLGVMDGYLDDPDRTVKAFADGHYHTGDLVQLGMDGSLRYAGRDDDMFKSFDHRISPLELERVLHGHPAVAQVAVVPVPDPVGLWIPKAFIVPTGAAATGDGFPDELFDLVRRELPPEKWVRALEFAPRLPVTVSGKIRRAELRELGSLGGTEFRMAVMP